MIKAMRPSKETRVNDAAMMNHSPDIVCEGLGVCFCVDGFRAEE